MKLSAVMCRNRICSLAISLAFCTQAATAISTPLGHDLFVGGTYAPIGDNEVMDGQMYVARFDPEQKRHPFPLILLHGAGQTAVNWLDTPDGRQGWADYFVRRGFVVYVVDQPARGRSAWSSNLDGGVISRDVATVEQLFTAPEAFHLWPSAKLHTQWPGNGPDRGRRGDPTFDAFMASQVQYLADQIKTQTLFRHAGAALLDVTGPAVIVAHSQAGPFAWLLADERPAFIKGIIALEPSGLDYLSLSADLGRPAEVGRLRAGMKIGAHVVATRNDGSLKLQTSSSTFWAVPNRHVANGLEMQLVVMAPGEFRVLAIDSKPVPPLPLTAIPLDYQPPPERPNELSLTRQAVADSPGSISCVQQMSPARTLPRMKGMAILIVAAQASFGAPSAYCVSRFLSQAGVANSFVRLEDRGIYGNGHMMMLERNNRDIAALLGDWIERSVH